MIRAAIPAAGLIFVAISAGQTTAPASDAAAQERPAETAENRAVVAGHPKGVTREVRASIDRGLRYLVAQQNRDGSWRTQGAFGDFPVAMTSLCGLALLAGGSTPTEGEYSKHVSAALTFILKSARRDGLIAQVEEESHSMHGHGFALLFLAECYGMEEDPQRQAQIRSALQRAIELTARSQSAAGGWLYTPDSGGDEGSVTITQVQGLRAARNAGIAVPKEVIDNAMKYLERSQNADGGIRYQVSDAGHSRPAITAAAVACWYNAGEYKHPNAERAFAFAERKLNPRGQESRETGHHYYAQFYLAQVMFLHSEQKWNGHYQDVCRMLQSEQSADGSWDGDQIGPVYGTAISLVILQLPYKHLPIMQR